MLRTMEKRHVIAAFGGHGTPDKRLEAAAAALGVTPRTVRRWETDEQGRLTSPAVVNFVRARAFASIVANAQEAGQALPAPVLGLAED